MKGVRYLAGLEIYHYVVWLDISMYNTHAVTII